MADPETVANDFEPVADDFAPVGDGDSADQNVMPWGDVASGAARNFLPAAGQFAKSTYNAIRHPIDTAKTAGKAGMGALQEAGVLGGDEYKPYAEAIGQHFADTYGSLEGFKHSLANDPVGVLGDLSIVLSGGGSLLAKTPAMLGRAGELAAAAGRGAATVGHYTNPFTPVVGAAKFAGTLGSEALGLQSGVGGDAIRTAVGAGYEGGDAARDFREHLRGKAPMSDPVDDARQAVANARREYGDEYAQAISKIDDTKPLDFSDIDAAFNRAGNVRTFKGQDISKSTGDFRNKLGDALTNWRNLDPGQYHTAAGLDALKKQIGEDFLKRAEPFSPESKIAGDVYNSIKQTIMKQNPAYGNIMKAYSDGQDQLREVEKTLSLKDSATTDTALRKLQSILRNNVNTNFGYRRNLADYIMRNGSPTLIQKLAGQTLNSPTPRGLGKFALQIGGELGLMGGAAFYSHPAFLAMAPMIAMSSPRIAGEASYYAGRAASPMKYIPGGTASAIRAVDPYLEAAQNAPPAAPPDQTKAAEVRGAVPVAGSEAGQSLAGGLGGIPKGAAVLSTGVGGSQADLAKHYDNYARFGTMSPEEQQQALAAVHNDTNISINERRRLEGMMHARRGPEGIPPGSRPQRNSSGLVRWVAPDGTIYSATGEKQ